MVIKFKPIKPGPFNAAAFEREIKKAVSDVGRQMKRDFESPVSTWNNRPSFRMHDINAGTNVGVEVYTEHDIFAWVSQGTNGPGGSWYPIRPRNARRLHYQSSYRAKTTPSSLTASSGGKYGQWITRNRVKHPGIQNPRRFDEQVAQLALPVLVARVEQALGSARSQSGHAI